MRHPEILAPVGSFEALEAAVRCGADAVYLGQKSFSARANSRNFDPDELALAVEYAHRFGTAVHQALNILTFDDEQSALAECIRGACAAGVDAFIVQDLGVAALVKRLAPGMPLHASTQMAIHSPNGVQKAKELGFSRVVLARELSKNEIENIRASTDLELEVFVHGAHCMSVSGQCYLSAMLGGKSGNRGQCAQPCRLPFACASSPAPREEAALSLKDLCLVEKLSELALMGIDSFKIEGRMKRPEYVAASVTACKDALEGRSPDLESLRAVFSRDGFTSAYYDGDLGLPMFGSRKKEDVAAAGRVLKSLQGLYHKDKGRVPVKLSFALREGEKTRLTMTDASNTVCVQGDKPHGEGAPVTEELAIRYLSKLGGTPFLLDRLSVELDGVSSLSAAQINALRREAVDKLIEARKTKLRFFDEDAFLALGIKTLNKVNSTSSPEQWGKFEHFSQVTEKALLYFDRIMLPVPEILKNRSSLRPISEKVTAVLPRFLFEKEQDWLIPLRSLQREGFQTLWCENLAHIEAGKEAGMRLFGGPFLNLTSTGSLQEARALGLEAAALSIEETLKEAGALCSPLPVGIACYGYLPLMSVRSCPLKARLGCKECGGEGTLTDRKGVTFTVRCDFDRSVSFLYNSVPLILSDRTRELKGFSFLLYIITNETPAEIDRVIEMYQTGAHPAEGSFTRGLLYRGVRGV